MTAFETLAVAAPDWWGVLRERDALNRLHALSALWIWVLAGFFFYKAADTISEKQMPEAFWTFVFSPLIVFAAVGIVDFVLLLVVVLLTYGLTGEAVKIDFKFLYFCTLTLLFFASFVVASAPIRKAIASLSIKERVFGGLVAAIGTLELVFTIRDVIGFFCSLGELASR